MRQLGSHNALLTVSLTSAHRIRRFADHHLFKQSSGKLCLRVCLGDHHRTLFGVPDRRCVFSPDCFASFPGKHSCGLFDRRAATTIQLMPCFLQTNVGILRTSSSSTSSVSVDYVLQIDVAEVDSALANRVRSSSVSCY